MVPPGSETNELELEEESAIREVESDLEELGDPEAAPALPSSTLATHTAVAGRLRTQLALSDENSPARELLRLAWPVMLTMSLATVGNIVDRLMIGWLDGGAGAAQALAGAAYATQFFFLIQSALFAVGLACVAIMARAIGSHDVERPLSLKCVTGTDAVVVNSASGDVKGILASSCASRCAACAAVSLSSPPPAMACQYPASDQRKTANSVAPGIAWRNGRTATWKGARAIRFPPPNDHDAQPLAGHGTQAAERGCSQATTNRQRPPSARQPQRLVSVDVPHQLAEIVNDSICLGHV